MKKFFKILTSPVRKLFPKKAAKPVVNEEDPRFTQEYLERLNEILVNII
jgi:hypothetical protein